MSFSTIAKNLAITAGGVLLAGFIMKMGKSLPLIGDAHAGFDS